eukprot:3914762-Pleurochrysis_carterae.AAC.1
MPALNTSSSIPPIAVTWLRQSACMPATDPRSAMAHAIRARLACTGLLRLHHFSSMRPGRNRTEVHHLPLHPR